MKKLAIITAVFALLVAFPSEASAHMLITDQTGTKGAILHIVPDDDPIAGKKATLFFDLEQDLLDEASEVTLSIRQENASEPTLPDTQIDGSLVTAGYVFPSQGIYHIRYNVRSSDQTYSFEHTTRVSRGTQIGTTIRPRHTWAEGLLIACGAAFLLLAIIAWNRRHSIARQSRF